MPLVALLDETVIVRLPSSSIRRKEKKHSLNSFMSGQDLKHYASYTVPSR